MKSTEQQQRKQILRQFMRDHYNDERLAMLLAHAQEGKLRYDSCCCFIGIPTSDHALLSGYGNTVGGANHYFVGKALTGAFFAEVAFCQMGRGMECSTHEERDAMRRRILIPMIHAEMRRRDKTLRAPRKQESQMEMATA